ncbi:hypothetical protein [Yoonia sp.]|uniref:hypothetical protein n=1 Tax=Yoonia sp. TaxID=2212373 RepID=UPI0025DAFBE1|nr:hypothetical protein [Yoonia sp.]
MPLDKLVLILVCVIAAAGVTIWLAMTLAVTSQLPTFAGAAVLSVAALCAYVAWRVISERVNNKDDDHYDSFRN